MEVGYYLNDTEVKEILTNIQEQKKFLNLINEMNKYENFNFDPTQVEVINGLKFDTTKEKDVFTAKVLDVKVNDTVNIRYITRYINGNVNSTTDFIVGNIVKESIGEEDSKVFHQTVFRAANDETITILEKEYEEEVIAANKETDKKFLEEFNFDEHYFPGQLLEQVKSEGFTDGCLGGGYIYCGSNCGGYPACAGSRSGINKLDNCCKTHDCCYNKYGVKYPHCYCDQRLCDCSQASGASLIARSQVEVTMCFVC